MLKKLFYTTSHWAFKFLWLLSMVFLFGSQTVNAHNEKLNELTIYFKSLGSNEGRIMVLVKDENNNHVSKLVLSIYQKSSTVKILVPSKRYAVVAYHDINGNEELDTNMLGMPTEPYGFSNDARGMMGEPDLADQLFLVDKDRAITFELK